MARARQARPTVYDVARDAGVSIASVSRYFSRPEKLSRPTRERIQVSIARLGYVQNSAARRLAGGRTDSITLCLPDFGTEEGGVDLEPSDGSPRLVRDPDQSTSVDMYYSEILRGVEIEARRHGLALTVLIDRDAALVQRLARVAPQVEGLVVVAPALDAEALAEWGGRLPSVVIASRGGTSLDAVQIDNAAGQQALTSHLLTAHGVRRPVFIGGPGESPDSAARLAGHRRALELAGRPVPDEPDWHGDFTTASGRELGARILDAPERPDAIVCANDETALGVLHAARAAGIRVPDDLVVTGFDDIPASRWADPALTTVRQPTVNLGRAATTLLMQRLEDAELGTRNLTLPVEVVLRASCGCSGAAGWVRRPGAPFGNDFVTP